MTWREFMASWLWEFWRHRVMQQMRRDHFTLDDAGYCIDARDRIK